MLGRDELDALEQIARRRGVSRSEAARQAIAETAARERRRTGLAPEARDLVKDGGYAREAEDVVTQPCSAHGEGGIRTLERG